MIKAIEFFDLNIILLDTVLIVYKSVRTYTEDPLMHKNNSNNICSIFSLIKRLFNFVQFCSSWKT